MSEEEDFVDSDDGSVADLDWDLDCCDSDVGSVADLEWDTWADACTLAFQGAVGAFPPEAAEIRPAVVFRNSLLPGEECANAVVSVRRDVSMSPVLQVLPVLQVTDKGVAMIPLLLIDMFNGRLADWSAGAHIMYDCAYCTLIVRRMYKIYEADPWIVRGWIIGVLSAGTRVSRILGPYRYVMIGFV